MLFMIIWTIVFVTVVGIYYSISVKNYNRKLMTLRKKQYKYWVEINK